mmetsp:Transcript_30150/g.59030  ORF Transcript_30150/g.59030 Transcript_30150/m.59030 type:complete len:414 (+) Transcript_30150:27-1268(+)|eukprot:CAMPEP_0175128954 /NCGR_PEP_ID=MMETSP0087-20121206/5207_1 /TAXON_ID=136419 /ORGANISM="Unknown Unknown, Strain D1" /LENGTH=413 /DNA_ID=CAMNT_0016411057 /DNA_START=24 /DNA_END=1265 /DNA_ORIENTATION=+
MPAGKLFDIGGKVLTKVSIEEPFAVGDLTLTAKLLPDGSLALSRVTITDNREERHQHAVDDLHNELHHRRQDLEAVEKDIQALMLQAQEGGDDADEVGLEIAKFLAVKGKHKRRVIELEAMETVSVKYDERHTGRSAVLCSGLYSSLSWFPTPVMWCSPTEEKEEQKVVHKQEQLPLSMTSAEHTTAVGTGVVAVRPNEEAKFLITARDHKGQTRTSGGDKFVVESEQVEVKCSAVDNNDGTYNVSYVVAEAFNGHSFPLSVSSGGRPIRGSPFLVRLGELAEIRGTTVSSCSSQYGGYGPEKSLTEHSYWLSETNAVTDQWIEYSFEGQYTVTKVCIQGYTSGCIGPKNVQVQICPSLEIVDAFTTTNNGKLLQEFEIKPVTCRKIRLHFLDRHGSEGGNYICVSIVKFWGY